MCSPCFLRKRAHLFAFDKVGALAAFVPGTLPWTGCQRFRCSFRKRSFIKENRVVHYFKDSLHWFLSSCVSCLEKEKDCNGQHLLTSVEIIGLIFFKSSQFNAAIRIEQFGVIFQAVSLTMRFVHVFDPSFLRVQHNQATNVLLLVLGVCKVFHNSWTAPIWTQLSRISRHFELKTIFPGFFFQSFTIGCFEPPPFRTIFRFR